MWDRSCYRKNVMLFHSRQLAQINLTSMSLIKFPHWSLAPLLSSADDLIPSVLGDGLWRAAGAIFHRGRHPSILLHHSTLFSVLSWLTTGVPSDLHLHLLPDPNRTHVMSCVAIFWILSRNLCVVFIPATGGCLAVLRKQCPQGFVSGAAQRHCPIQTPGFMATGPF